TQAFFDSIDSADALETSSVPQEQEIASLNLFMVLDAIVVGISDTGYVTVWVVRIPECHGYPSMHASVPEEPLRPPPLPFMCNSRFQHVHDPLGHDIGLLMLPNANDGPAIRF